MPYRVVFELTDSARCRVEGELASIRHLMAELGPQGMEVELVAHSDGVVALLHKLKPDVRPIEDLAAQGVRFAACQHSLASRGLTAADLVPFAQVVPSGIGEVVRRQAEGWLYVHP